jgi:hypothetical protein
MPSNNIGGLGGATDLTVVQTTYFQEDEYILGKLFLIRNKRIFGLYE